MSEEASCAGTDPKYFLIFSSEKTLADRKLYSSASSYKRNADIISKRSEICVGRKSASTFQLEIIDPCRHTIHID